MPSSKVISKDIIWIVGIWASSQVAFYLLFGIRLGGDSGRYIEAARNILNGVSLSQEQWYYLAYEWMLVPIFSLGGGNREIVFSQCFLALIGAFFLYGMGKMMFSQTAGVVAAIAYLIHPSIQRWNYYVLTEELTTAALIMVVGLAVLGRERVWGKAGLIPAAIVLALVRPETLFFLLPVSAYLIDWRFSQSVFIGVVLLVIVIVIWSIRPGSSNSFGIMQHWMKGTYIWGYPGVESPRVPFDKNMDWSFGNLIIQSLRADPLWVMKILTHRVYYFLIPTRPFFSQVHNMVALGSSALIYGLAFWGSLKRKSREVWLIWAVVLVQVGLVALTWSDWDSRWLDRVMPFLILLAAGGGAAFWNYFGFNRYKTI